MRNRYRARAEAGQISRRIGVREDSQVEREGKGSCHEATFVERRTHLIRGWARLSRFGEQWGTGLVFLRIITSPDHQFRRSLIDIIIYLHSYALNSGWGLTICRLIGIFQNLHHRGAPSNPWRIYCSHVIESHMTLLQENKQPRL